MVRARDNTGRYIQTEDPIKDAKNRMDEVHSEMGYSKNPLDQIDDMNEILIKKKLMKPNTKLDELGFSQDFYNFLGLSFPASNYYHDAPSSVVNKYKKLTGDSANYFTPMDDFYGTPGGGDTIYDSGRVPVSHLMVLCSRRLGIAHRACSGIANDVFSNRFDFVKYDNPDKVIEFPKVMNWMRTSHFWDKCVDMLDFNHRSGLGHLVNVYNNEIIDKWSMKAPLRRPDSFEAFSAYYMTPINIFYEKRTTLDYDKQQWDFIGGFDRAQTIHHSRVYVLETMKVEGGFRGIALPELCWVPLMCYLNTMYYILKDLSTMGTVMAAINVEAAVPSTALFQSYLNLWDSMKANKLFLLGKGATFNLINAASKIGQGIESYLEFLREDISAAWIIPKNQLFGRADGGGLQGAGAVISKEDYLASNIGTKQLNLTNDIMSILIDVCGWTELEGHTLRWNIDLHKTLEQRLREQLMKEQVEMAKIQTKDMKLLSKLNKAQVDLQIEMSKTQKKMLETDPEKFMNISDKDEENVEEKPKPSEQSRNVDFLSGQEQLRLMKEEYNNNKMVIESLIYGMKIREDLIKNGLYKTESGINGKN